MPAAWSTCSLPAARAKNESCSYRTADAATTPTASMQGIHEVCNHYLRWGVTMAQARSSPVLHIGCATSREPHPRQLPEDGCAEAEGTDRGGQCWGWMRSGERVWRGAGCLVYAVGSQLRIKGCAHAHARRRTEKTKEVIETWCETGMSTETLQHWVSGSPDTNIVTRASICIR